MHRLFPQKLLTLITTDALEPKLAEIGRNRGASGYTFLKAHGEGANGETGELDMKVSLKCHMTVPQGKMSDILDDIEALIQEGHHLTVFVSDVAILSSEKLSAKTA